MRFINSRGGSSSNFPARFFIFSVRNFGGVPSAEVPWGSPDNFGGVPSGSHGGSHRGSHVKIFKSWGGPMFQSQKLGGSGPPQPVRWLRL